MLKHITLCAALLSSSAWAQQPAQAKLILARVGPAAEAAQDAPAGEPKMEWVALETLPDGSQRGRFRVEVPQGQGRGPLIKAGVVTLPAGPGWSTLAAAKGFALKASLGDCPFDPAAPEAALPIEPVAP